MNTTKFIILTLTTIFGLTLAAPGDDTKSVANTNKLPPASTKQGVTYAADIKPIFDSSCVKCHSGDKPKAKLGLDSLAGALKGDRDGKVIITGDSAKSLLVLSVAHLTDDKDTWMPPVKNKAGIAPLTPEQIGLIRAWIDQGAK
jgi:mono/diheme cytochrome c family protein